MIPYGKQDIRPEDIEQITDVLRSNFLTQGPLVPKFEDTLSNLVNVKYVTAVNSATSALHIACLALGLKFGDLVWTVPNTFVASANCALYCGAKVDFVDIDPETANLSVESLKQKLVLAERTGNLPKIVIPVHLAGEPCDMAAIKSLSDDYGFKIIEDASHAIGAQFLGRPVGSCDYSDITVFSFHPVKIITCGEGGAALTNCKELDRKLKLLRSHGITRDKGLMRYPTDDAWYYEQVELGYNYRMTDIHAALGLSQLTRLDEYVDKRHEIAAMYDLAFASSATKILSRNLNNRSALHLYVIQVDEAKHRYIFNGLREKDIGVNLHYIPVHTHPYYQKLGFQWGDFPNAEKYYRSAISLPIFPSLKSNEQNYVIKSVKSLCNV